MYLYYRTQTGRDYGSSEFALPDSLNFLVLLSYNLFSEPFANFKALGQSCRVLNSYVRTFNSSSADLYFENYPKVFILTKETLLGFQYSEDQTALPDSQISHKLILKQNKDQVILVEKGDLLYLFIPRDADEGLLKDLLGTSDVEQIAQMNSLEQHQNKISESVN